MKTTIKCIAPWLAAAAIGGAIGLAPIASAAPATTSSSHDKVATSTTAPAPTPFESGTDPRVPSDVGADPLVPYVPGTGRPF
jgi:PPE-repeat protein